MTSIEEIYEAVAASKSDMEKGMGGNKAAATRARVTLSKVAKLCKEARGELLAASKDEASQKSISL